MESLNIPAVKRAWAGITKAIGLSSVENEADYDRALTAIEQMIEEVRGMNKDPLHGVIAWLAQMIEDYESKAHPMPILSGPEFLRALMNEHDLRQIDLPELGKQHVVLEILQGKRRLNARQIAALSKRFNLSADIFLS